jgi:hypothetical protein
VQTALPFAIVAKRVTWTPVNSENALVSSSQSVGNSTATSPIGQLCWQICVDP